MRRRDYSKVQGWGDKEQFSGSLEKGKGSPYLPKLWHRPVLDPLT